MRLLIIAAYVALAGCAGTVKTTFPALRSATMGRAVHAQVCESVEKLHDANLLRGESFNRARRLCIDADAALDEVDAAVAGGGSNAAALANASRQLAEVNTILEQAR